MAATHGSLILGLNIRGDPAAATLAVNFTSAVEQLIGWAYVAGLEVGNESNIYGSNGIRPANYSYADYADDFRQVRAAVMKAVPDLPLRIFQAGAFSSDEWDAQLPALVALYPGVFTNAALHFYPTTHCGGNIVTVAQLLSDAYARMEADYVRTSGLVRALQRADAAVGLVVGEGNSASCFGAPGVSNSFASALWTLDSLMQAAGVGLRGWSFTVGGLWGSASEYGIPVTDAAWQYTSFEEDGALVVEPMYYAMRMFAMATSNHSTLVHAVVHSTTNAQVKLWAAASATHLSVVAIHKNLSSTVLTDTTVCVGGGGGEGGGEGGDGGWGGVWGRLVRLVVMQGNASAEFGIVMGGQTYDGSVDGEPVGSEEVVSLQADDAGCFRWLLEPISATLLSIPLQPAADAAGPRSTWGGPAAA